MLNFGFERTDVDAEEFEPVEKLKTGVEECPVHDAFNFVQKGDSSEEEHEEVPKLR